MTKESKSFSFTKWVAGIVATVIAAVVIWWLTHPGGFLNPVPVVMDVSGTWLTPFNDLSYEVIQDGRQYRGIIRETGWSGTGTIEGNTLVSYVDGKKVVYEVARRDSKGNPVVLFTTHPDYFGVVMFRTCRDFKMHLDSLGVKFPKLKSKIYNAVKSVPNPTCPNILD